MKKVLIAYATNAGTTAEVARAVGEEIQKNGNQADVQSVDNITTLDGYDAVILGAPMIMGWHRGATRFLKKHQQILSKVPVALFITCMSLIQTGETQVDGVPVTAAPNLPQSSRREGQLSFRERYTTVTKYLHPILKASPQIKPVSVAFFGGRLDMYRLKWWQALFVILIIQASPGEKRDWEAIHAWASKLFV